MDNYVVSYSTDRGHLPRVKGFRTRREAEAFVRSYLRTHPQGCVDIWTRALLEQGQHGRIRFYAGHMWVDIEPTAIE